jgi:hypothetical protein
MVINEAMIKNYVKGLSDEKYMQLRNSVIKGIEEEDNRRGI